MLTIASLFSKSPFAPLQTHMEKVAGCITSLTELFEAIEKKDFESIESLSKKISKLEHEADLTKNDIRNHLPKSVFLPIDRSSLLEILSLQDSLADKAEDIAISLTLYPLHHFDEFHETFTLFCKKNVEAFWMIHDVIKEIEQLLESSFGGIEAEKVKQMVEDIAHKEHKIDLLQYDLLKKLYAVGDKMTHVSFHHWMTLFREVGSLSNISEKLGNRIRMLLELK